MLHHSRKTKISELLIVIFLISFGMLGAYLTPASRAATDVLPESIARDCSRNVTSEINDWLAAASNGTTLQFEGGCFRIDQTLLVLNKSDLTIDGQGATFKTDDPTGDGSTREAPSKAARTRAHWRISAGSNVTLTNMTVKGAHPNGGTSEPAYVAALEAQHGFDILGTQNAVISGANITDVYGDFVYFGRSGSTWSSGRVTGSRMERNGRQGIAVTAGRNIHIDNNYLGNIRRATFDFEPNGAGWGVDGVVVDNNEIGPGRLLFIASQGEGLVNNITVTNNRLIGRPMSGTIRASTGTRRTNWAFENNVADTGYGSPGGYAMGFVGVDNIRFVNNTQPLQSGRNMHLAGLFNSTGVVATGNTLKNGTGVVKLDGTSTSTLICNNRFNTTGDFNQPIVCPVAPDPPPAPPAPTSPPATSSPSPGGSGGNTSTSGNESSEESPASPTTDTSSAPQQKPSNPINALKNSGGVISDPTQPLVRRITHFVFVWLLMVGFALGIWWVYKHKAWEYLMPRHHMAATGGGMSPGMIVGDFTGDNYRSSGIVQKIRNLFKD